MAGPTPRELGFRMPAEWEPHEATWLAWPHNKEDWPGRFSPIPWIFAEIVRKLAAVEKVRILIEHETAERQVRSMLRKVHADLNAVEFFHLPTNRVWTRDFAPLFVRNASGEIAITDWIFNAWAKYDDWHLDNAINPLLAEQLGLRSFTTGTVLEGGSIDVNGAGLLLTTEECLLSQIQARNPALSCADLELLLSDYLGIDRTIWLGSGIVGDDTHGHIDDLARFVRADTVVVASEDDPSDENYQVLRENLERLKHEALCIVKLPMPAPVIFESRRLPASYANFYIANKTVLVPTFSDPNDRIALNTLAELFSDRRVVGVNCLELVWGLGTLHCMTQQQPA